MSDMLENALRVAKTMAEQLDRVQGENNLLRQQLARECEARGDLMRLLDEAKADAAKRVKAGR